MSARPTLVLLGMMTKMPVAGVVWQTVQYLTGFSRLGYDVYYVEAHARTPSMLMERDDDDGSARAAAFIAGVMARFDLGDRWAFHALHDDGQCFGLSKRKLSALYRDAALIVNLHGGTEPLPAHAQSGRLVYLETDPVQLQVELDSGLQTTFDFLEPHCAFFTFAENLGGADCGLPVSDRYRFRPTRQPVVLDFWADEPAHARDVFTTIGNWRQSWRSVQLHGESYEWSKHHEFLRFLDIPARTGQRFELALSSVEEDDKRLLATHGWRVKAALPFSMDVDAYRRYVMESRAEFTVAKDQNVRLRTGWFSDRSATYLASGRPVVTQDTGFGCALPVGHGLFAFSSAAEITDAVQQINANYRSHRRAAREIAREHFDAAVVLERLLDDVGLPSTSTRSSSAASALAAVPSIAGPRVAVVIPCFNLGEYLPEAVESVRVQTRPADEVIIVDDGSTDPATRELLDRYAREGLTVLRTENRGASAARNHGITSCRAEYVLCLDSDDVLAPEFLEQTVAALNNAPDAAVATTHVEFFGDRDGVWETSGYGPTQLLAENCIASASLFRRVSWRDAGGYADLDGCQDWDLWLSMIERGWRWTCVPEVLYRYRVRNGSISDRTKERRPQLVQAVLSRHADTYRKNFPAVFAELDSEVRRLRALVRDQEVTAQTKDEEVLFLKETLHELRTAPREGTVVSRTVATETPFDRLTAIAISISAPQAKLAGAGAGADGQLLLAFLGENGTSAGGASPEHVERLRREGAEFLLVPPGVRAEVESDAELVRHLECGYHAVVRDEEDGLVFDLREQLELPTFSIVICTYRRPELLRGALESALAQDYPLDRFEVIVVDNEPSEAARAVVTEASAGSSVPVLYYVEEQTGLSLARTSGICRARGDYVAFLDDDAVAGQHWLSAFAAVANQYGALVVGGRVEPRLTSGGAEPRWFREQYARGFFGLNYRDWGKTERVFRIRRPLYLGGGNSAYARRLFQHFGGFRPELGRTGSALLAAEETHLNALLEQHDVPIYYSDDAVVEHLVAPRRLTRRHVRRKAYCAGVSDAILEQLLDDAPPAGPNPHELERRRPPLLRGRSFAACRRTGTEARACTGLRDAGLTDRCCGEARPATG